jgi:hypothetical protein
MEMHPETRAKLVIKLGNPLAIIFIWLIKLKNP